MTIASETARNDYIGSGATATFSYSFRIDADSDLLVVKKDTVGVETILALTTDFTVTGAGDTGGGSITLMAGNLPSGYALVILRGSLFTQGTDIRNQGDYYPEIHEDTFDTLTMHSQQLKEILNRVLTLPVTSTVSSALPAPVGSKYLRWNSGATAIELVDNVDLSAIVSPMTTKGDLLTRNSSGYEKLGVGTDGQLLIADSASTGGMKWTNTFTFSEKLTYSDEVVHSSAYKITTSINYTMTGANSGSRLYVDTDAVIITLPQITAGLAGLTYTFVNAGADGTVGFNISPNATDAIWGGGGLGSLK